MSIPPRVFAQIQESWMKVVPDLDCTTDENFCTSKKACDELSKKLKPIGIQMSNFVFEIPASEYTYQADGGTCYFVINECKLTGKNRDLYLMGDAFLKHYYSAFDFDKNEVSLGVNTHSEGKVRMFSANKSAEK